MKKILKCFIPCFIAATMCLGLVQASSFIKAEEETVEQVQEETTPTEPETATEQEPVEEDPVPEESTNEQPITEETETSDPVEEEVESEDLGETETIYPSEARTVYYSDTSRETNIVPAHDKTVTSIPGTDDDYWLSLNVTGAVQTETGETPKVDVVLVVDTSGSMDNKIILSYDSISYNQIKDYYNSSIFVQDVEDVYVKYNGDMYQVHWYGNYYYFTVDGQKERIYSDSKYELFHATTGNETRMTAVHNAVADATNGLSKKILENPNIDAQMAVVTFNEKAEIANESISNGWTRDVATINNAIPTGNVSGGTNYEDGLIKAKQLIDFGRDGSQKFIIFLSDGKPTAWWGKDWFGYDEVKGGEETSKNIESASNAAYEKAGNISGLTGFYTIGFGVDYDKKAKEILDTLSNTPSCTKHGFYLASDTSGLVKQFDEIVASITSYAFTKVSITDKLSGNVELSGMTLIDGKITDAEFTITDSNGKKVEDVNAKPTILYDTTNKTINIQFPSTYELIDGYTYTVRVKIRPNQNAYDTYINGNEPTNAKGQYPNKVTVDNELDAVTGSEFETGGSSSEGFYSNTAAKLTYDYKGKTYSDIYEKDQYVKVNVKKITATKVWKDNDHKENSVQVALYKKENGQENSVIVEGSTRDLKADDNKDDGVDTDWKTEWYVPNQTGVTYSVKEVGESNSQLTTESEVYDVTYSNTDDNWTITNTFRPDLTITKEVKGLFGDKNGNYKIKITLSDSADNPINWTYKDAKTNKNVTFENGQATVTLNSGESVVLKDIPYGYKYTVAENSASSEGYTVSYTLNDEKYENSSVALDSDDEIVVTNTKDGIPITGIGDDNHSSIGMIGIIVAELGAIYLVLRKKRQLKM